MDNKKFGEFVAGLRKEKGYTQSQLAEILCVTDKAVSKWERGVGFPDIKLIEPLSEALGVSILEIMQSEKAVTPDISTENASDAIANVIDVVEYQRKIERRNIVIGIAATLILVMLLFLLDLMQIEGFIFVCLPIACLCVSALLIAISIHRKRQKLTYAKTLALGIGLLILPIVVLMTLYFSMVIGGPIPN